MKSSQGDIDVFLDRSCYFALLQVENYQIQIKFDTASKRLEKFSIIYSLILTSASRIKDMMLHGHMDMDTENLLLIPTSEYISHPNVTYEHMSVEDLADIQRDFATEFEGRRTNVQVKKLCNSWVNYHPTISSPWYLR